MTKQIESQNTRSLYPEELVTLGHPEDVLNHPTLSLMDKRAILAEWASDAHCIEGIPSVRQLPCGGIIKIDAILKALAVLDEEDEPLARSEQRWPRSYPRRQRALWPNVFRSRRDDDDDPPPAPATVSRPPPGGPFGAGDRQIWAADCLAPA